MDFSKLLILEGKKWDVKLHHNQNCLGKCVLWFKGEDKDFADLDEEEQEEFWELLKKVKGAVVKLFNPDKINYASLGMVTNHLHFHVIPRYSSSREFEGETFIDENWGKFPPTGENILDEDFLEKLKSVILEKF